MSKKYILENGVYVNPALKEIAYKDGSEEKLLKMFEVLPENYEITDLVRYIEDWPTRYHLSIERRNIIDAIFEILQNKKRVLELGGGLGAISSYLIEKFEEVDIVEGSYLRAKVNALRLSKQKNRKASFRIFCDDIVSFEYPDNYYDIVFLIGVLEYIPFFQKNHANPLEIIQNYLQKVLRTLKDDGILVLAIENKFGAKYLAGCKEDHNNRYFSSIIGYPFPSPITFSYAEFQEVFENLGVQNVQFYFPFEDYKLPMLFIKDCEEFYKLKPSGLFRGNFKDYSNQRLYLYSDSLFVENLIQSSEISHFANSFLIVAGKSNRINLDTSWIVRKYWNYSDKSFHNHFLTEIFKNREEEVLVKREKILYSLDEDKRTKITKFIKGKSLYIQFLKEIFGGFNVEKIKELLDKYLLFVKNEFSSEKSKNLENIHNIVLARDAIDATLWNIIEDSNKNLHIIDNKWSFSKKISLDFLLFRNFYNLYPEIVPYFSELTKEAFIISLMKIYDKFYDYDKFLRHEKLEIKFQKSLMR